MSTEEEFLNTEKMIQLEEKDEAAIVQTVVDAPSITEGLESSGIQIASEEEEAEEEEEGEAKEEEEDESLSLGDSLRVISERYNQVEGVIYYFDSDLMSIKPNGMNTTVIDFPLKDGTFDEDLGIQELTLVKKGLGASTGFIAWQGFFVDQVLDSYLAEGKKGPTYTIVSIQSDDENDRMIVRDESGKEDTIDFNFRGIPQDLGIKTLVIKSQIEPLKTPTPEQVEQQEIDAAIAQTPGAEAAITLGVDLELENEEEFNKAENEEENSNRFEEEIFLELKEIKLTDRVYPELIQKSELLTDIVSLETNSVRQQNPAFLKTVRTFVELCSALKNSIIERSNDGSPSGELPSSLITFADVLKGRSIPIAKPVLETKRVLLAEAIPYGAESEGDQVIIRNLKTVLDASSKYLETQGNLIAGEAGIGIPRWYQALNEYFHTFPTGDVYPGGSYSFVEDGDYFRSTIPGDDTLAGLSIIGSKKDTNEDYSENPEKYPAQIQQSLRRGHGPILRPLEQGGSEILLSADEAQLVGHIVFPYKVVRTGSIGAIRTGSLFDIMKRSTMDKKPSMAELIETLGGEIHTEEEKDAQSIFYVANTDSSVVGISFADYLQLVLQTLVPCGNGDLFAMKSDLGITEFEFNVEQQEIIQARVKQVIAALYTMVRSMMEKSGSDAAKPNQLFESNELLNFVENVAKPRPLLQAILKDLAARTPGYKSIDIAVVSSLLLYAQDYALNALGGNQQGSDRAEQSLSNYHSLKKLQASIQLAQLHASLGSAPQPNPCEHVAKLELIRKIENDTERMKLLVKFANEYSNDRDGNWITCMVCNKHLICHHEVLQIQQYLHPTEKDVLQKQIVLEYAGGLFGRSYICRNCGLPISELEFDTSVEFDDNGRPMMGRSELVDTEEDDELHVLFQISKTVEDESTPLTFETDIQSELYQIARVVADAIGVSLDNVGYSKIVERANAEITTNTISEDEYSKKQGAASKDSKKSKQLIEYVDYISRKKIGYVSALVLFEIQTHMPDYVVKFYVKDCSRPGFGGFPIKRNSSVDSPEDCIGLEYISCIVAGIVLPKRVWKHGFQKIKSLDGRKAEILSKLKIYMRQLILTDLAQSELEKKRSYLEKLEGYSSVNDRAVDSIPSNFLPRMIHSKDEKAVAALNPSVKEGSHKAFGQILEADTWIRALNEKAKEHTVLLKGNPFTETACCFESILQPGAYIATAALPALPARQSLDVSFRRQSLLYTPMIARDLQLFNATPADAAAYRVFLQLCWKGDRVGLPHEIGYDHKCDWCGVVLPTEYLYPDVDKAGAPIVDELALRSQFDTQGIPITDVSFQQLLDDAHRRTVFQLYKYKDLEDPNAILLHLGKLQSPPVVDWFAVLEEAKKNLLSISDTTSGSEVVHALQPLSQSIDAAESRIIELMGSAKHAVLKSIIKLPPTALFEVMRSYFLVPAQRMMSMYESRLYLTVQKYYKLSEEHTKALDGVLELHTSYLHRNPLFDPETGVPNLKLKKARMKLKQFIATCSGILKQATELRLSRLRYDPKIPIQNMEAFMNELMSVLVFGPVGDLVRSEVIPKGITKPSEESDTFLFQFVSIILGKYMEERLSYDPESVRQKLEASKEREKQRFIGELDGKDEEERRVELLKKQLGIGRWAIGGTKLVYSYDADQWDKNRMDMERDYAASAGLLADSGVNVGPSGVMLNDGIEYANYEDADRGYGEEGMDFGEFGDDE
jgi:hypothetical protein